MRLFVDLAGELFCLRFGVEVVERLDLLALFHSCEIVGGDLDNERGEDDDGDQVGDHHQTVKGIRDVPSERRGQDRAENNGANVDDAEDKGSLCSEEVLPCLRAVMRPAKDGGEGKEEHGDRDELLSDASKRKHRVEGACNEGRIGVSGCDLTRQNVEYAAVESAGSQNDERRHRADHHRIGEDLKDAPHTLLDGLLDVGVRVHHDRRAKTRLV